MIKIGDIHGDANVRKIILAYAVRTGRIFCDEFIATARLICVSLATSTQPYGNGEASKKQGEWAVARDIKKIFLTPAGAYAQIEKVNPQTAREFWDAFQFNDGAGMRDALNAASINLEVSSNPRREVHMAARNRRGRTKGPPKMLITNEANLEKYIQQRQKMVGFAKAGWAAAADDIGGHRGIPMWASGRHKSAPGMAVVQRDAIHPRVTLYNRVSYIRQVLPESAITGAIAIAYEKLVKRMSIIVSKTRRAA